MLSLWPICLYQVGLRSQPVIVVVLFSELKTLDVNSNSPVSIDITKKTELISQVLSDITGLQSELAVVALQVLTGCLRWECLTKYDAGLFILNYYSVCNGNFGSGSENSHIVAKAGIVGCTGSSFSNSYMLMHCGLTTVVCMSSL